jgi:polyhydroxyalkanoate synthesis regulator phasin
MVRDETQHSISMLNNNPMMKKLVATGEERVGKLVQQLMSNEKFVAGVQSIVSRAFSAKGLIDKSIKTALSAMNLPSTGDITVLKDKIEELETLLDKLDGKLDDLAGKK